MWQELRRGEERTEWASNEEGGRGLAAVKAAKLLDVSHLLPLPNSVKRK